METEKYYKGTMTIEVPVKFSIIDTDDYIAACCEAVEKNLANHDYKYVKEDVEEIDGEEYCGAI